VRAEAQEIEGNGGKSGGLAQIDGGRVMCSGWKECCCDPVDLLFSRTEMSMCRMDRSVNRTSSPIGACLPSRLASFFPWQTCTIAQYCGLESL